MVASPTPRSALGGSAEPRSPSPAPQRAPAAAGEPRPPPCGWRQPREGAAASAKAAREVCSCGHAFVPEASFCPRCGGKRPVKDSCFTSLAEMVAMVEGLQTGAAQGVFDTVKAALDSAALSAADAINANMKTIICTAAGSGNVSGVEAVGLLRTARLQGTAFSGHVGHHSNQQVICHLLHLVVQLALFPQGPMTSASQQAGCPFSAFVSSEVQATPPGSYPAAVQTDPGPTPPPTRNCGPCVGVRIGGGYHLFHAPEEANAAAQRASAAQPSAARAQSPSGQARPLLEDMASETVRLSSADRMSPPEGRREVLEDSGGAGQTTYALGARSENTRLERYRVSAFVPTAGDTAAVVSEREIKRRRDGEGVQLSRFLCRSAHRADGPPHCAQRQRSRRPGSANAAKLRAGVDVAMRPASVEAGSPLSPGTVAAVRRLREWAASDAEGPPPQGALLVGRPFLADW